MNKEVSLYLDMIGFLVAIVIFLGHTSNRRVIGEHFSQANRSDVKAKRGWQGD